MLYFENDYSEGACAEVLESLVRTNSEKLAPYGNDKYSLAAKEKIRLACSAPEADVFLLTGGTQTNKTVIAGMLKSYEGVIAASTGHISLHEAGAVEVSGHKVITLDETNGKLSADVVQDYLGRFFSDENHEHMVFPGMVYISHPTEYGTLYSKKELTDLSVVCKRYNIPLFLDGARLGYGLASIGTDLTLSDIAALTDVFYIGGTKVGALCGEAVVFPRNNAPAHFLTIIKQNGAMLAKSRLVGVQFDALFTDELYLKISRRAISSAAILRKILRNKGYRFLIETETNQIFVILENEKLRTLRENVKLSFWEKYDADHTVVRFATSWATEEDDVFELEKLL